MHKFFSSRNLVIFVICLILSIGLIGGTASVRNNRATPTFVQKIGNDVVGIGDRVFSGPSHWIANICSSTHNLINAYHENDYLKSKVQSIEATNENNQALKSENNNLKNQLKLNKTLTGYKKINASVMTRTPSTWQQQLIINKGSANGIKKNMAVIVNKGLIGRISEVNRNNSKVELITDSGDTSSKFSVYVNDKKTPVNGLISGYNNGSNELEMGSLTSKGKIKKGAKVMTNGLGGITPKGLYVGKVAGVSGTANGISEQINIKPATDTRNINAVTVIDKD